MPSGLRSGIVALGLLALSAQLLALRELQGGAADPLELADLRCSLLKRSSACVELGLGLAKGGAVSQDLPRARALFHAACERGFMPGCSQEAVLCRDGLGAPRDLGRAVALFAQACREHDAQGCAGLGQLELDGEGVARDEKAGAEHVRQGCGGGSA